MIDSNNQFFLWNVAKAYGSVLLNILGWGGSVPVKSLWTIAVFCFQNNNLRYKLFKQKKFSAKWEDEISGRIYC